MVNGTQVAQLAKEQITLLTGHQPETISKISKSGDSWHVTVDTLELKRIPASTEILAAYDVVLDEEGNLLSYRRTRRYCRGQTEEDDAA